MSYQFQDSPGSIIIPDAYERLLIDALLGDASLFVRSDEIELSWKFIDGILAGWGPEEANYLIEREGRWWIHNCAVHQNFASV